MIGLGSSAFLSQSFSLFLSTLIANHAAFSGKKTILCFIEYLWPKCPQPITNFIKRWSPAQKASLLPGPQCGEVHTRLLKMLWCWCKPVFERNPSFKEMGKKLQKKASLSFPVAFYFKNFLKRTSLLSLIRELPLSHSAVMNRMRRDT